MARVIVKRTLKIVAWVVLSLCLLVCAVAALIYSSWSQELLRQYVVAQMSEGPMRVNIDRIDLSFPLDLEAEGLDVELDGVMAVEAGAVRTDVELLPLLRGEVRIGEVELSDARLTMGRRDTAMYLSVDARMLSVRRASVGLRDMNVDIDEATLDGAHVAMILNPDTTTVAEADTTAAEPSTMKIGLKRVALNDFACEMRMLPIIDSLGVNIPAGELLGGIIDMSTQSINLSEVRGDSVGICYLAPDSATVASIAVVEKQDDAASAPWTIEIDTLDFENSHALYSTRGVEPIEGLDFAYIDIAELDLKITEFYNQSSTLRVPLQLSGKERSGVDIALSGIMNIDEVGMSFDDFSLSTPNATRLDFSGKMGMGDMAEDATLPLGLDLKGEVATADVELMFPVYKPYLAGFPANSRLRANIDVSGTTGRTEVNQLRLALNENVKFELGGTVRNVFNPDRLACNIDLSGNMAELNTLKDAILDSITAGSINLPRTEFRGQFVMDVDTIDGYLIARTEQGDISLDAAMKRRHDKYEISFATDSFPVDAFMPLLGIGEISTKIDAKGYGFDVFSEKTQLDADINVARAVYKGYTYRNIDGYVKIRDGEANVSLTSPNKDARFTFNAGGNLDGNSYEWAGMLGDVHFDLKNLGLSDEEATATANIEFGANLDKTLREISTHISLANASYTDQLGTTKIENIVADFEANDHSTGLTLENHDMRAKLHSYASLDTILVQVAEVDSVIAEQIAARTIDVESLQAALPHFTFDLKAGRNNMLNKILEAGQMRFKELRVSASNEGNFDFDAAVEEFEMNDMRLDTLKLNMSQYGSILRMRGGMDNRPGTLDNYAHVDIDGYLAYNQLGIDLRQRNISGVEGYRMGVQGELAYSAATLSLAQDNLTISYAPWTINPDNYLRWDIDSEQLSANIHLEGHGSKFDLYTVDDEEKWLMKGLIVELSDIEIADWANINPFSPPMKGLLSADFHLNNDNNWFVGSGSVELEDFFYDRRRVGTISSDISVKSSHKGGMSANVDVSFDNAKAITMSGAINDSTAGSPLAMNMSMIHFPLAVVNPFLPKGVANLRGALKGEVAIKGTAKAPAINGWVRLDSTEVKADMLGAAYAISPVDIPIENNVVKFNQFAISGTNNEPLLINGVVDLQSLTSPKIDLSLVADNFQICNTSRAGKHAQVYGKGYLSTNTTIKGNTDFMMVKSTLTVLPGTNISYIMADGGSAIANQANNEMVKFVNFNDTTAVDKEIEHENPMAMLVEATLKVSKGSTITVDLSPDGSSRARLQSEGALNFKMMPFGEPTMIGRLDIHGGYVRYLVPIIGQKTFNFTDRSYVAFNGDLFDPIIDIHTTDPVKSNIAIEGQGSRIVEFDVSLDITGSLSKMDITFDVSTDGDMTVANELQSMTPEQRATEAMNLLLYGTYSGNSASSQNGNISNTALSSFISSKLNSWAANNISGVDFNFGIENYDRTSTDGTTRATTHYSYEVSKTLFNDRFKIVVGGSYSTDMSKEAEISQSLIKDVSLEYVLNSSQTMTLKLFRHTGYESILEGEITKTGVGFVYKRKLANLRNMFRFGRKRKNDASK